MSSESGIRNGLLVLGPPRPASRHSSHGLRRLRQARRGGCGAPAGPSVACMVTVAWTGRGRRLGCVLVTALTSPASQREPTPRSGHRAGGHVVADPAADRHRNLPDLDLAAAWLDARVVLLVAHVVTRAHTWTANPVLPGLTRGRELWAGTGQLAALSRLPRGSPAHSVAASAADVSSAHALAEAARRASLVSARGTFSQSREPTGSCMTRSCTPSRA